MKNYFDIAFTPSVKALQEAKGSSDVYGPQPGDAGPSALDPSEIAHITARDSFYMSTVSESGWPYVQHRGGEPGFVSVLGPTIIGWIERTGNRQYLGSGNITADGRVALILVDYPSRTRLKLFGRATYHPEPSADLVTALNGDTIRGDGAVTVEVEATDWNCPKYITPRYTAEEVRAVTDRLQARVDELEARLAAIPGR
jgi:predicted pyridoxine 5'-phosphate oxidase superfamily flavin-nucleotide-binding protein